MTFISTAEHPALPFFSTPINLRNPINSFAPNLTAPKGKIQRVKGKRVKGYRHTVATELMQKPEQNLYVTQKLLGHRDIKVTLSYIEHNVEMLRSCVERD